MDLRLEKLLCRRFATPREGPLQGAGRGKGDMEDKSLPMQQVPQLHVTEVPPSPGYQGHPPPPRH